MSSGRDYERGRQAGMSSMPSPRPRSAAEAMGQDAGRAERDRNLRLAWASRPQGETPKTVRTIVLIMAVIVFGPLLLIPFYLLSGIGVHAAAVTTGILGLLVAWPLRKLLGPVIALYLCLCAGLIAAVIENLANNRPQTVQNLFFPMFCALTLGVCLTIVMAVRRR